VQSLLEQVATTEPEPSSARHEGRRKLVAVAFALLVAVLAVAGWQARGLMHDGSRGGIEVSDEPNAEQVVKSATGRVFSSRVLGETTQVDELTSTRRTIATLDGAYTLRIADRDGTHVALADVLPPDADIYRPGRRASTHLAVVDTATGGVRHFDIPRNVEPEAFGIELPLLFVIDHRPALQPDHYRVGYVDLESGTFDELIGPNKTALDIDMTGTARQQVPSASGDQLYTLYVHHGHDASHDGHQPSSLPTAAFVHVLDLRQAWAYCVDLPAFGHGPLESAAIAISDDGRALYVADSRAGRLAVLETSPLTAETLAAGLPPIALVDLPGGVQRDAAITVDASNADVVVRSANKAWVYDTASRSWR
jgi:hypothetical protein